MIFFFSQRSSGVDFQPTEALRRRSVVLYSNYLIFFNYRIV